jgi:hypothetical protein
MLRSHISTSTAQRYEDLAGSRGERAMQIASAAMKTYFAKCAEDDEQVSYNGLRSASVIGC